MNILPKSNVIISKHDKCQVVIIDKLWKNKLHPVPGLYCADHGKLIKWLSDDAAQILEDAGVENLGMLKTEETTYNRRIRLLQENGPKTWAQSRGLK